MTLSFGLAVPHYIGAVPVTHFLGMLLSCAVVGGARGLPSPRVLCLSHTKSCRIQEPLSFNHTIDRRSTGNRRRKVLTDPSVHGADTPLTPTQNTTQHNTTDAATSQVDKDEDLRFLLLVEAFGDADTSGVALVTDLIVFFNTLLSSAFEFEERVMLRTEMVAAGLLEAMSRIRDYFSLSKVMRPKRVPCHCCLVNLFGLGTSGGFLSSRFSLFYVFFAQLGYLGI